MEKEKATPNLEWLNSFNLASLTVQLDLQFLLQ